METSKWSNNTEQDVCSCLSKTAQQDFLDNIIFAAEIIVIQLLFKSHM